MIHEERISIANTLPLWYDRSIVLTSNQASSGPYISRPFWSNRCDRNEMRSRSAS